MRYRPQFWALLGLSAAIGVTSLLTSCAEGESMRAQETASVSAAQPAMGARSAVLSHMLSNGVGAAPTPFHPPPSTETYANAPVSAFVETAVQPVSTFSADVDTASYAYVRRFLNDGLAPPRDAVRVEELVNYFDYAYEAPADVERPFAPTVAVHPSPWNPGAQILHVGIKGFSPPPAAERPPLNLVFLVDVSGSMNAPDKLPLAQKSLRLLLTELDARDRVALVAYAGAAGIVLEPTAGDEKAKIAAAIDRLAAGGSTAGAAGIDAAYALAREHFAEGAVNRVILATDGDFNVGASDPKALKELIAKERDSGVYLNVLGFGAGNLQDATMQALAQTGNGIAAYIDGLAEARRLFVDQLGAQMLPIANDAKFQIEFNPARIARYRLIGYETRLLNEEDFANDRVDAGEINAGHTVTALYEIVPVGAEAAAGFAERRYTPIAAPASDAAHGDELAHLRLRYKLPGQAESRLIERPVIDADVVALEAAPADLRFAAAVAGFALRLRGDERLGAFGYAEIAALAEPARGPDPDGRRAEFLGLVRQARALEKAQGVGDPAR